MYDLRVFNAVKDRMLSRRGFLTCSTARITGATLMVNAPKTGTCPGGSARVFGVV